jgi:hypothetical protein
VDRWAWDQLEPWPEIRHALPIGAVLCVIHGPTAGRRWEASTARKQLHHAAASADIRRRFAPHQLPHAHAVEMAHEGVPLVVIQRQLGHYAGDPVKATSCVTGRVDGRVVSSVRSGQLGSSTNVAWIEAVTSCSPGSTGIGSTAIGRNPPAVLATMWALSGSVSRINRPSLALTPSA